MTPLELDVAVFRAWLRGEVAGNHVWINGENPGEAHAIWNNVYERTMSEAAGALRLSSVERLGEAIERAWPRDIILGLAVSIPELERQADREAKALARHDRYLERVSAHRRRRPGCSCLPGAFYMFLDNLEGIDEDHAWTLRILRRARRAAARAAPDREATASKSRTLSAS